MEKAVGWPGYPGSRLHRDRTDWLNNYLENVFRFSLSKLVRRGHATLYTIPHTLMSTEHTQNTGELRTELEQEELNTVTGTTTEVATRSKCKGLHVRRLLPL